MIFSKDKWRSEGITKFVSASNALSYETMEAPLNQAWMMFFMPLLDSLCDTLTDIFNKSAEDRTAEEITVLCLAQNALANLALWYNFTELNTRLTDQGHQRQETENFKSTYKYQEDQLRQTYKNKGFNALDMLLQYLDDHIDTWSEWKKVPAYGERQKAIVRNAKEVNDVVFINKSNIIFLRFLPLLNEVDQVMLPSILGASLYDALHKALDEGTENIGDTTVEELRIRVGRVMINLAAAQLIRESGTLTDRGLYFESLTAGKEGNKEAAIPGNRQMLVSADTYEHKAAAQIKWLQIFIKDYISDLFAGFPEDAYKRDNDHKHTFWT